MELKSSTGTTHYSSDSDLRFGFEYLEFLRHHFVGRINKITPSGRLQSAVLIIIDEGLLVCSNRGGLHRYLSLENMVSIQQLPRGRLLFEVKDQHSLLLSIANYLKVLSIIKQLVGGLCRVPLDITATNIMPPISTLNLRPPGGFSSKAPAALREAVRLAAMSCTREIAVAQRAALEQKAAANVPPVVWTEPQPQQRRDAISSSGDLSSARVNTQAPELESQTSGGPTTKSCKTLFSHSVEGPAEEMSISDNTQWDLTIVVAIVGTQTITFPATVSLWEYVKFISKFLPGATQSPSISLRSVHEEFRCEVNQALFYQTMLQYTESVPHTVTVRRSRAQDGLHFDSTIFWANPLDVEVRTS